ncbi:MAG: YqgE/AlgH family protein [Planctomycetota bacterium]
MTDPPEVPYVESGMLLAAWPDLLDPNFMHRVVLICQHRPEGAFGLVTNQRTEVTLGDLFPDHEGLAGADFPVFCGGPVDASSLHFVHRAPDEITGGLLISEGLWLGGELDSLAGFVGKHGLSAYDRLRVFVGYSGWGAGQLDLELIAGSWVPAPPSVERTFAEPGESAWRLVVRSVDSGDLSQQPPDASWN